MPHMRHSMRMDFTFPMQVLWCKLVIAMTECAKFIAYMKATGHSTDDQLSKRRQSVATM